MKFYVDYEAKIVGPLPAITLTQIENASCSRSGRFIFKWDMPTVYASFPLKAPCLCNINYVFNIRYDKDAEPGPILNDSKIG